MTVHVASVDWSFTREPMASAPTWQGLSRAVLVGPAQGAIHTELAVGALSSGGWLQRHFHSFEEALYVLAGELLLEIDGHHHRLVAGDYAFMPLGAWHALANQGPDEVRWLSVNTPVRLAADAGRRDTFFDSTPFDLAAFGQRAGRPPFGDPRLRYVGHYEGTPPQVEALALTDPARGRRPAGRDTALVVYSGISVKMLVDRVFGAELLTMFTVDYEPGGSAQVHDHPFEEAYFFLDGEIEAELEGHVHTIRAGDVVFAGVGATHGFFNNGSGRVRWIETQAPQPPERHSYRWVDHWRRFEPEQHTEGA
ncbi:MAG TPA: cupin domain-containing protein [Candidatus Limnocylindria bacterium]|nr:cupin domain-containing protein [Candidatus Limnocylindria bacterium]